MDDVKGDNLDANEEEEDEPDKPRTETTSKGRYALMADIATQPMLDKKGQSSQEPEKVQNQPFDEAVEVDDSGKLFIILEEVSSGSDNDMSRGAEKNPANFCKLELRFRISRSGANIEWRIGLELRRR